MSNEKIVLKDTDTLLEFLQRDYPKQKFLIENLFLQEGICMIAASPASMKSYLSLYIAKCILKGEPFLGKYATQKGAVLLVDLENPPFEVKERLEALIESKDFNIPLYVYTYKNFPDFDIKNDAFITNLIKIVREKEIKLIIFDSLIDMHRLDEDKSTEMIQVFKPLKRIQAEGCTVLLLHHNRKGDIVSSSNLNAQLVRGSSGIFGAIDSLLMMDKHINGSQTFIDIFPLKNRGGKEERPFNIEVIATKDKLNFIFNGYEVKKNKNNNTEEITKYILNLFTEDKKELNTSEIIPKVIDKFKKGRDSINDILRDMCEKEILTLKKGQKNQNIYILPVS